MVHVAATGADHPNRLVSEQVPHQVEEVTTLLDQRSARVPRKPIPVPDFRRERTPVLPDGHHAWGSRDPALHFVDDRRHRRAVSPRHAHPGDSRIRVEQPLELPAVLGGSAQGLLQQQVWRGGAGTLDDALHYLPVRVVGSCNDEHVDLDVSHQVLDLGKHARVWSDSKCPVYRRLVRVRDRHHLTAGNRLDVPQMLAAHVADTDDCIPKRLSHLRQQLQVSGDLDSAGRAFDGQDDATLHDAVRQWKLVDAGRARPEAPGAARGHAAR